MDMSLDYSALGPLFALSRDAVTGIENGIVRFANPAAQKLLGVREGDDAGQVFPEDILRSPSERFVAAGSIGGRSLTVSVTRHSGLSLYVIPREEPSADRLPEGAAAEMGALLMTERMAIDRLVDLSGAASGGGDAEKYASILYRTHFRAKRLQTHLAMTALLQKGALPCEQKLVALDEVAADICDTTRSLAADTGVELRFEAGEPCRILGDRRLLEILLFNLLSNSLLHTKPGDTIRVTLAPQGQRCILAVDDNGEGIPPDRLAELLPGGAHPDMANPAAGTGLGLPLARGIAELHGGVLLLESREDGGARLRVSFPLLSQTESFELNEPEPMRPDGADLALTELSVVLDRSVYTPRMFD